MTVRVDQLTLNELAERQAYTGSEVPSFPTIRSTLMANYWFFGAAITRQSELELVAIDRGRSSGGS